MSRTHMIIFMISSLMGIVVFQNCGQAGGARSAGYSQNVSDSLGTPEPELIFEENAPVVELPPIGDISDAGFSCLMNELDMRWPVGNDNASSLYISRYDDTLPGAGALDYNGGDRTSDEYSRIDFATPYIDFKGSVNPIFSAANGKVIALDITKADFIYDSIGACSGNGLNPNFIAIEHANGFRSVYYGLRNNSTVLQLSLIHI